jgi:hypothetical protein
MDLSLFRRALLAAALGLGATAGLARAGEPPPHYPAEAGPAPADHGGGHHHHRLFPRLRNLISPQQPLGCYSHFNDYSCNSLPSTCDFIFGGCRKFFSEACLKGPPASPVPGFDIHTLTFAGQPGYPGTVPPSYGAGYGAFPGADGHSGNGRDCRCR